jgi:hypothetical protein
MASAGFGLIEGSFDPEYQRVKQRFQAAYPLGGKPTTIGNTLPP